MIAPDTAQQPKNPTASERSRVANPPSEPAPSNVVSSKHPRFLHVSAIACSSHSGVGPTSVFIFPYSGSTRSFAGVRVTRLTRHSSANEKNPSTPHSAIRELPLTGPTAPSGAFELTFTLDDTPGIGVTLEHGSHPRRPARGAPPAAPNPRFPARHSHKDRY